MTNAAVRTAHLKDTIDLYSGIASGELPAVSFVKPSGLLDGHPASSKWDLFEGFSKKIIDLVKSKPELWESTAIFVTADEGGGYYDSGYVQPVDFFGDGTRIPLIAVSPHSTGGRVSHEYTDHVSILKFIERNWRLAPVTGRSRDNLPNPVTTPRQPVRAASTARRSAICSTCSTSAGAERSPRPDAARARLGGRAPRSGSSPPCAQQPTRTRLSPSPGPFMRTAAASHAPRRRRAAPPPPPDGTRRSPGVPSLDQPDVVGIGFLSGGRLTSVRPRGPCITAVDWKVRVHG